MVKYIFKQLKNMKRQTMMTAKIISVTQYSVISVDKNTC